MKPLPPHLLRFLRKNDIDIKWFSKQAIESQRIPRFVWLPSLPPVLWNGYASDEKVQSSKTNAEAFLLANSGYRVDWTKNNLWAVPQHRTLSRHEMYKKGQMFGIDAASIFSVDILDPKPGDDILDLCCAPGAKLAVIADRMNHEGKLVGIDNCFKRLDVSTGIAKSLRLGSSHNDWSFSICHLDGAEMKDEMPIENIRWDHFSDVAYFRNSALPSSENELKVPRARNSKRFNQYIENCRHPISMLFDKVIVDTQCTHEGSIRHILKHLDADDSHWSPNILESLFEQWCEEAENLAQLQRKLIAKGFERLKPGGTLVYSTCSFCQSQNENIVQWLLSTHSAVLDPLVVSTSHSDTIEQRHRSSSVSGRSSTILPGTVYLDPIHSGTSGLFVARITKPYNIQKGDLTCNGLP